MSGSGKTVESQVSHLWPVQTRTAEIVSVYGGLSAWWQSSYLHTHTRTQELTEYKYLYLWFRHWPWVRPLQHYSNRKQVTIWTVFVFALRITYMEKKAVQTECSLFWSGLLADMWLSSAPINPTQASLSLAPPCILPFPLPHILRVVWGSPWPPQNPFSLSWPSSTDPISCILSWSAFIGPDPVAQQ